MNKLSTLAAASFALVAFTTQALALNPQPEPPGKSRAFQLSATSVSRPVPGSAAMLNPQPLPPKARGALFRTGADAVMLNPQPLPPKEIGGDVGNGRL